MPVNERAKERTTHMTGILTSDEMLHTATQLRESARAVSDLALDNHQHSLIPYWLGQIAASQRAAADLLTNAAGTLKAVNSETQRDEVTR